MVSPTRWTWVWASSGVGDGQGSLACFPFNSLWQTLFFKDIHTNKLTPAHMFFLQCDRYFSNWEVIFSSFESGRGLMIVLTNRVQQKWCFVSYDTASVWLSFSVTLLFCDTYSSVTQISIMRKPKLHEGTIQRNFQATTPANVFGWTFVIQFLPPALRLQQTSDILEQR